MIDAEIIVHKSIAQKHSLSQLSNKAFWAKKRPVGSSGGGLCVTPLRG
jgi:hypothetical protein